MRNLGWAGVGREKKLQQFEVTGSWETFFFIRPERQANYFCQISICYFIIWPNRLFPKKQTIFFFHLWGQQTIFVTPKPLAPNLQCNGVSQNVGIVQYLESKPLEHDRLPCTFTAAYIRFPRAVLCLVKGVRPPKCNQRIPVWGSCEHITITRETYNQCKCQTAHSAYVLTPYV